MKTYDLFSKNAELHIVQNRMARNIGQLKDKQSKKHQAHMLVMSLVRMIKGLE